MPEACASWLARSSSAVGAPGGREFAMHRAIYRPFRLFCPDLPTDCRLMLEISPTIAIADDELVERFVRSSGPGGQNVNKVATAVELRFDAANSPSLPEDLRRGCWHAAIAGSPARAWW